MDSTELSQYKELFLTEMEEQLQLMEEDLLRLEQEGESQAVIQSLFRVAHTIKGSSAVMGFQPVKMLTHEMEHVLDKVRNREQQITTELTDLLFQCLDHLQMMKEDLVQGEESSVNIDSLTEQLAQALTAPGQKLPEAVPVNSLAGVQETHQLKLAVTIAASCEMKLARSLLILQQLQEHAEVIKCSPSPEEGLDDSRYECLQITCAAAMNGRQLQAYILSLMDVEQAEVSATLEQENEKESPPAEKKRKVQSSVRVNVEQLEHLMNLVGELVIDQTRIHQVKGRLARKYQADEDIEELEFVSDHVNKVVSDLQNNIMKARMIPIEQLFNRFPRMIRDLNQSLQKEVELILTGTETELDRSLIEEIGDPLIHLIRNAMDHGLEAPAIRAQKGKPLKGQLRIAAAHEDNQVVITVEDDGAGIDPDRIRQTAVQKQLIAPEEAAQLTDQEAVQLIFHSGFSTASQVSEVSGRGVGMDIVRSHIEKLNGLIDIDTCLGRGTCFRIKLPLTLAIIVGLLVRVREQTYIIPMSNIAEIVRAASEDIQTIRGQPAILLRNQVIPIAWVHDHFRIPRIESERDTIPLVIVGSAEKRLALAVDELIGNQEIVIKTLGNYVGKVDGIAGATILGDGKVALILEIPSFIHGAGGNR